MKKSEIAKQISESVSSHAGELIRRGITEYWWFERCDFRNILHMIILCRLFEKGIRFDYSICSEFKYNSPGAFITYNEIPLKHPLMYGVGVYIISMKKIQKPSIKVHREIMKISEKIIKTGLPKHNYLSWAFSNASSNDELLSFIQRKLRPDDSIN